LHVKNILKDDYINRLSIYKTR